MNSFVKFMTAACFLAPVSALSEVRLELGHCIDVHVVDGREVSGSSSSPLTLENGLHQLVVDCSMEVGRSSDEALLETSDAFVIRFQAAETNLRLSAPEINSVRQLEEFNRAGNFQLKTSQDGSVEYRVGVLEKEGYQILRDYREELEVFNRSSSPAAVAQMSLDSLPNTSDGNEVHPSKFEESRDQEIVTQMLRYWYLKADKKTRNELESWIHSGK